jgi:molybdopterin-guanine dinucleotide biosynthesis protein A
VTGALLLGGASRRMGRDKARLRIGDESVAARLARLLAGLFEEVLLVGGDPPADAPGRRVPDREGPRSALRGLVSALEAARGERVLVLATDLPLVPIELLLALLAFPEAAVVAPRDAHGVQPLCALYRRAPVLALAAQRLAAGELALHGLLDALEVAHLEQEDLARVDPEGVALFNLNTPEDLERLRARAPRAPRSEAP